MLDCLNDFTSEQYEFTLLRKSSQEDQDKKLKQQVLELNQQMQSLQIEMNS